MSCAQFIVKAYNPSQYRPFYPAMRLSVIIPAHRSHAFIGDALDSLAAQQRPDGLALEVIVVADDGADYAHHFTAARRQTLECLSATTGRIAAGPSAARNIGLNRASGDFISFLDADDLWLPGRAAALLPLAAAHGAAVCRMAITSLGAAGAPKLTPVLPTHGHLTPQDSLLIDGGFCPVYRRDCITHIWDEDLDFAEDLLFNHVAVVNAGGLFVHPQPLMHYRIRPDSATHHMPSASHRAERAYAQMLSRLSLASGETATLAACLHRKRRLNAAYLQAWQHEPGLHFEQFVRASSS